MSNSFVLEEVTTTLGTVNNPVKTICSNPVVGEGDVRKVIVYEFVFSIVDFVQGFVFADNLESLVSVIFLKLEIGGFTL
jgi:hypothetical protein